MTIQSHLCKPCLFAASLLACCPLAFGQSVPVAQPEQPSAAALAHPIEFDIAVFKIQQDAKVSPAFSMPANGDGFVMRNRPMRDLVRIVYTINSGATLHFRGQPAWVDSDRWDVEGKVAEADIPAWQKLDAAGKRLALRGFLARYLKLTIHYDTQDYPCYALELGKGAPKIKEHKAESVQTPDGKTSLLSGWEWTGASEMTAHSITMTTLAQMLSGHADRTVVDRTGLTGEYDFVLKFDTSDSAGSSAPERASPPLPMLRPEVATPIEFSAVKEQLGLKLVSSKAPIEGVVIEHMERPSGN